MNSQPGFFDFAAEVGLTKYIGGIAATNALTELCHIGKGSYVLDVGCGVGATPCWLAQSVGCRVVGVDIMEKMVASSRERARRERLAERVEFMEIARLKEIVAKTYAINLQDETQGLLRRYGLGGMLRVMGKMLRLYVRSPAYREFVKSPAGRARPGQPGGVFWLRAVCVIVPKLVNDM